MERNMQAYNIESQNVIRRQQKKIARLKEEQAELLVSIEASESRANQRRDREDGRNLRGLLEQQDQVQEKVKQEQNRLQELDKQIREWEKRILSLHRESHAPGVSQNQKTQAQRRVKILENQLNVACNQFNTQLGKNAALRKELHLLHVEWSRFQRLHNRLLKKHYHASRIIAAHVDSSASAFSAREEAQGKASQLREKAEKEAMQRRGELRELQRLLDHEERMRLFLAFKSQERGLDPLALEARKRREWEKAEGKRRDPRKVLAESYKTMLKQLEEFTGETDIKELMDKYLEVEERNFAQFNYVNEQNHELERLREEIQETEKAQAMCVSRKEERLAKEQKELAALEEQQEVVGQEAKQLTEKIQATAKTLELLKAGIGAIFTRMSCDSTTLEQLLGGGTEVRDNNIGVFFALIERRLGELLTTQAFLDSKDDKANYDPEATALLLLGQSREGPGPRPSQPRLPFSGEEPEFLQQQEAERPLSHGELKAQVLQAILAREQAHLCRKSVSGVAGDQGGTPLPKKVADA
ncbi:coiled-coil domain-containing protein 114 isoform X2 [Tachyglossus aculeatus]|nr:coiled-coil domain-containing protein 114 isoform X2 [Tachyglossus aculeatus]